MGDDQVTDSENTFVMQRKTTKAHLSRSRGTLISLIILSNIWQSAAFPFINQERKAAKLLNRNLFFKSVLLILTVLTNTFHSTNLFSCFSCYQAPTKSVPPYHTQPIIDSFRRMANARNFSFRISLRWPIHIINLVDKTKLSGLHGMTERKIKLMEVSFERETKSNRNAISNDMLQMNYSTKILRCFSMGYNIKCYKNTFYGLTTHSPV